MAFPHNIAPLALFYFFGLFHELGVSVKIHIRKIFLNHIDGKVNVVGCILLHDRSVFIGRWIDTPSHFPPVAVTHQIFEQLAVMP